MGEETETFTKAAEDAVEKAVEKKAKRMGMLLKWVLAPLLGGSSIGAVLYGTSQALPSPQMTPDEVKEIIRQVVKDTAPDPKDIVAIKEALLRMEGRQAMADNGAARDKAELQKDIAELRRLYERVEGKINSDVEMRLRALEQKVGK